MAFSFVRQNDQSDCGAAALATIALHYGRPIGLQQMRELAGTDRVGTNLVGMVKAAKKIGFAAKAVHGPYEALSEVPLPAIAHVRNSEGLGHFVVLHRVSKGSVTIADPAHGIETLSKDEFCNQWSGYLLIVSPDVHTQSIDTTIVTVTPLRRFVQLLREHTGLLIEAVFAALLMTLLGIASAYFIQHLVDSVLVRQESKLLNALGLGMVMLVLFRVLFAVFRQYILAYIGRRIDLTLVANYTQHLLDLPLNFFEMRQVGEILSRINDTSKIRTAISGATATAIVDGLLVLLLTGILFYYDARLAALASVFIVVLICSTALHHPLVRRRSRELMENAAQLSAHYVEDVSAIETIKAFGAQWQRVEEGELRLVRVAQTAFSLQMLGNSMASLSLAISGLSGIAVLWYGGYRVMTGALTIGELVFFHSLLGYLLEPLERLASVNMQLQDALVAVDRLGQITDIPTEQLDEPGKAQLGELRSSIELRSVTFGYGCRSNVLEDIDLHIPKGKTTAIIGESGSGKSTLLKLITGYYAPSQGQVIIDGIDARDYKLSSIRNQIAVVSQDPYIFTGTVRENIALGSPDMPLERIVEAARIAGLAEFIDSLPQRYDTVLGERGANMSGGQRQRLAIARAVLRSPSVLIFDEATSHLDSETERAVQESLRTVLAGKTVILVAHRLSTIKDADQIYVLGRGRVVEYGNHRQLIRQAGAYAALWAAQSPTEESFEFQGLYEATAAVQSSARLGELQGVNYKVNQHDSNSHRRY